MTDQQLPSQEPEASDLSKDGLLLEELGGLVENDTNAPYIARRTTLFFGFQRFVRLGGHFPSGVAYYAIAIIASTVFLCSDAARDKSFEETLPIVGTFLGSALVAQTIDAFRNKD